MSQGKPNGQNLRQYGQVIEENKEEGSKEKALEQYMEYIPNKTEQEARLENMMKQQDDQV